MRLKEDKTSWHSSAIIKRDFKHGNVPIPERSHTKGHKDTRRWCRGRIGREHLMQREIKRWYPHSSGYIIARCAACRKEFYTWNNKKYNHLPLHIEVDFLADIDYTKIMCKVTTQQQNHAATRSEVSC